MDDVKLSLTVTLPGRVMFSEQECSKQLKKTIVDKKNHKKVIDITVVDFAKTFDMPVVVTGDFNYKKGCDFYNEIISSGLSDAQDLAKDTMTGKTYHGYNGGEEGLPIDFIFVNDRITDVSKYRILTTKYYKQYTSDHYPIYADMKF